MPLTVLTLTGFAINPAHIPFKQRLIESLHQEYPGADDRGGVPEEDGKNFVTFLKELDEANKKQTVRYSVSFTAPTSYWYLRHFDLKAVDYVDFINVMSYE
jgi:chitinase